ncbi:hypothetical protein L249_4031 [Ophiocordyceps polyrhachis-furcata BCC 54312]|uniref:Ribokinase n=1 Tax=Ophiocordyceps polyrhachis-furcata BCC 54312 TaxID=1330021 RepID=A0A367L5V3_9HYPO|nr:hypothetical protein L249_4031 [Ophiocordyceps polyrhachis-furcata BCC 54312]
MDSFLAPSKRKSEPDHQDDEPTEIKLALLASLYPDVEQEMLLDVLAAHQGSVDQAAASLSTKKKKKTTTTTGIGQQSSLRKYAATKTTKRLKANKGTTLHLYDPEDVAEYTPCTIIHDFLPQEDADSLLRELLAEAESFERSTFKLFDNVVSSPHTTAFFVESLDEVRSQRDDYYYNGAKLTDVRRITPQLAKVKKTVEEAVNGQVQHRIVTRYPGGRKLRHQPAEPWRANSAFVNCYKGGQESVGWHSDQLTYLGPRAVIGSISLGVAREFRVRRVVVTEEEEEGEDGSSHETGAISIHLPHNSLLVMHAEMQESWKHCIAPALVIDPHPVAGNRRINITYRDYREAMHPKKTPRGGGKTWDGISGCAMPGTYREGRHVPCLNGPSLMMMGIRRTEEEEEEEDDDDDDDDDDDAIRFSAARLIFPAESAALLQRRLPPKTWTSDDRPFVTLTWAASLDGKLSVAPGVRTRLSGPESKAMTHYLRRQHDAILIGVSTMLADDPALNCRLAGADTAASQPRPVVIDPHLRWTPRPTDKVLVTSRSGAGLAPYVVTGVSASDVPPDSVDVLQRHGGRFLHLPSSPSSPSSSSFAPQGARMRLDWRLVLASLRAQGLKSVMIEGGGFVIESLLESRGLVDSVIVTIAPTWLGRGGGVGVCPAREEEVDDGGCGLRLCEVSWHPFGDDIVLCGRLEETTTMRSHLLLSSPLLLTCLPTYNPSSVMARRKRITVLGSLNADVVPYVAHHPLDGETVTATSLSKGPGGKGANQAVACARLSRLSTDGSSKDQDGKGETVEIAMVGAVGDDPDADMLRSSLSSAGVDVSGVQTRAEHNTGVAIVVVDSSAENRIIVSPEANHALGPSDDVVRSTGQDCDLLVLQLEMRLDTVVAAIMCSKAPVLLNAAPATKLLPRETYARIAHLIVNQSEAALLLSDDVSAVELETESGLGIVADRFLEWGVLHVVVTLGSRGVFYADSNNRRALVPASKVTVVDTTAAGDTFVGAYALAVVRAGPDGFDIDAAVREANRAAAVTVSRKGAQTSIPWGSELA